MKDLRGFLAIFYFLKNFDFLIPWILLLPENKKEMQYGCFVFIFAIIVGLLIIGIGLLLPL